MYVECIFVAHRWDRLKLSSDRQRAVCFGSSHDSSLRNGHPVPGKEKGSIVLQQGDIVKATPYFVNNIATYSGTIYSEGAGVFTLEDVDAKLKFIDEQGTKGNLFHLIDGTVYYDSHEVPRSPGEVRKLATGRNRLVKTNQRSLGTRGTKFRLTQFDGGTSDTATLSVFEGAVIFPKITDTTDGPLLKAPISGKKFTDQELGSEWSWLLRF